MFRRTLTMAFAVLLLAAAPAVAGEGPPTPYTSPSLTATPTGGGFFDIEGSGCLSGESVLIDVPGTANDTTTTANAVGEFAANVFIGTAPGEYPVQATCGSLVQNLVIVITPTGDLTLSPSQGTPGTNVTATSSGHQPGEVVSFTFQSDPIALGTATADANGVAVLEFEVPDVTPGSHTVTAASETVTHSAPFEVLAAGAKGANEKSRGGALPRTGQDSLWMIQLGVALVGAGALVTHTARRRRQRRVSI